MKCPGCQAEIGHVNAEGNPMIRTRGIILKADGVVAVCPKCKADVAFTPDLAKALATRLLVVRSPSSPAQPARLVVFRAPRALD